MGFSHGGKGEERERAPPPAREEESATRPKAHLLFLIELGPQKPDGVSRPA